MTDDELVPYDLTPEHPEHYVRVPPGWEFRNLIPRSAPDPIAMAVMSDVTDGEEYLSLLVRFGVMTEAEAQEIREEVAG